MKKYLKGLLDNAAAVHVDAQRTYAMAQRSSLGVRAERPCHVQGTFAQRNCQKRRTSAAPRLAAPPQILPPPVQLMHRLSATLAS